jgi:hypothetical protein
VAGLEERLREMWPSQRSTLRDLSHALERHGVPELVEVLDHPLDAVRAVLAQLLHPRLERRVVRIDEVRKDVHIAPFRLGVQLGGGNDAHAEPPPLGGRFADAGERVVIRERLRRHATRGGAPHELGRRERSVGADRVRVEVDRVAGAHRARLVIS